MIAIGPKKKQNTLRAIWFFLGQYKIYFIFLVFFALIVGFLESLNVALMYPIVSEALGTEVSQNAILNLLQPFINMIPVNDALIRYSIFFLIIAITVFTFKALYYFYSVKFTSHVVKIAKQDVFNKCYNADYQFYVDNKQGEILYKIAVAPNSIAAVIQVLSDVFVELFLSISVFAVLFAMSWKLVVIIAIGGVFYYYFTKFLGTRVSYKAGIKKRESGQKERVIVSEYTTGIKQIKVFETFPYWNKLFDKVQNTFWFYHRKNFFWTKMPEILLWLVLYISVGSAIIGIILLYPGDFMNIIPLVGIFGFGVFLVLPKLSKFGAYRMKFMHQIPNVEVVYDWLKDKEYSRIKKGTKQFKGLKKGITFKNVKFSHMDRDILLENINLEIKKDKTTALVGPSGSGKTTIVNLLLRLYDVDEGGVYIDDVNIKKYDIVTFFQKVGFVSQDTFIFNATVKENIAFGGDYTDEEIANAAKMANADEFIEKLPEGYDTIVGDRGLRISGGEKQRIAIARAIIRQPEILFLDEATSSLDGVSENIVQKAIDKVSKSCTTFIIAHRLSTIKNADIIHVLDNGKIVESGSHEELMKKKRKYWELYTIQEK